MAYFPIIRMLTRDKVSVGHRPLPTFYMGDYSVLGFQVSDCQRAMLILEQHHFPLKRTDSGVEVGIDGPSHMQRAMQLLTVNGLACEISDVADGMYQG